MKKRLLKPLSMIYWNGFFLQKTNPTNKYYSEISSISESSKDSNEQHSEMMFIYFFGDSPKLNEVADMFERIKNIVESKQTKVQAVPHKSQCPQETQQPCVADTGSRSSAPANQRSNHSARSRDMPSEDNLRVPKVNTKRLSKLACWILQNTGDGIERGEIVARFYKLPRLYCNFYVDPCFGPKQQREHDRKFRYAQPRVSMALKRLENRGLLRLIRHGRYVKEVCLTEEGSILTQILNKDGRGNHGQ